MKQRIFILIFLLLEQRVNAALIASTSIPKSGTFLLEKALRLITGLERTGNQCNNTNEPQKYLPYPKILEKCIQNNAFCCFHLGYRPEYEKLFKQNNTKVCFIYRDPRDQLVSQVYFMLDVAKRKGKSCGRFTFDSLLTALIGNNNKIPNKFEHFQDIALEVLSYREYISHIKRYYELFLRWRNSEVCYSVKFEDLVGAQGGGSAERQELALKDMAKHIGTDLDEQHIKHIASNLFGSSVTFREGQIGSWQTHFKEHHKKQFKAVAGDLLIQLGYEKNNNW